MRVAISDRIQDASIEEKILGEKISLTPNEETEVLLVWHAVIEQSYIDRLPKLKYIVRYGVGFDKVDIDYARSKGIIVSNTPDYCTDEVSDTALAFIVSIARGIVRYNHEARSYTSGWQENVISSIRRSSETTVGFIGAGRIGQSTILKAKAMNFKIIFYDPYVPDGVEKVLGVKRAETLDELLKVSDIVSLHVPLTSETKNLVNDSFISRMKDGASLVNTARGGVVEDLDLFYGALKSNKLSNVFLDVLPQEPATNSKLFEAWKRQEDWLAGRLLINPHASFYSQESGIEMREKVALNARRFINGERPVAIVNEERK